MNDLSPVIELEIEKIREIMFVSKETFCNDIDISHDKSLLHILLLVRS